MRGLQPETPSWTRWVVGCQNPEALTTSKASDSNGSYPGRTTACDLDSCTQPRSGSGACGKCHFTIASVVTCRHVVRCAAAADPDGVGQGALRNAHRGQQLDHSSRLNMDAGGLQDFMFESITDSVKLEVGVRMVVLKGHTQRG